MGVPTFYTRLLQLPGLTREAVAGVRLFVSGSAPLLAETHAAWSERTGHAILERYGMTETNMNTSNPYDGDRVPGSVGMPFESFASGGPPIVMPHAEYAIVESRAGNVTVELRRVALERAALIAQTEGWREGMAGFLMSQYRR